VVVHNEGMARILAILLLSAALALGATVRVYLKDGTYQLAREYRVEQDRVHFYSTERSQWEDIPLNLVDLKRTEAEAKQREESQREEAKAQAEEDKADRAAREEVERVPVEPGAYMVAGTQLKTLPLAETKILTDKRRSILKAISPVPILSGKGTVELDREHSKNVVDSKAPEFYIRLAAPERFGIIRLAPHKGNRVVEELSIIPVSKEIVEKQDEVQVFRRQVADGLYKIWPMKPLEAGEYAVVEFTPATNGSINIQTWDFSVPAGRGQ
jgi:hypothetical protein